MPVAQISIVVGDAAPPVAADPASFEKLGGAVAACKMKTGTDFGIDPTCAEVKAYEGARAGLAAADQKTIDAAVAPKFLANPSAPVRALGVSYLSTIMGAEVASSELVADAMAKEKDPAVLSHMVRMAGAAADRSPKVASAVLAAAKHGDKSVRFHAAVILENPKIAGATPKMLELAEKDPASEVRDLACSNLGQHGDEALAVLEKLTADAKSPGFSACFIGLVKQWASFPRFDTSSEKAYRLTLKRLGQKPRGDRAPPFVALTHIGHLADDAPAVKEWRKKNTWFKPDEVVKALGDVIMDPTTGHSPRFGALDAALKLGATKTDLEAWRKTFGDSPTDTLEAIAKRLDEEIQKASK